MTDHFRRIADEMRQARARLREPTNTPATSGDVATQFWQDLLDKDDRTSPEGHPEMALITFDEFRGYIEDASAAAIARLRAELDAANETIGRAIINLPPEYRSADPNDGIKSLRAELEGKERELVDARLTIFEASNFLAAAEAQLSSVRQQALEEAKEAIRKRAEQYDHYNNNQENALWSECLENIAAIASLSPAPVGEGKDKE